MSQMKSSEMDENLINKIISAAYKDAPIWQRLFIMWKAERDPKVKALYLEYKHTAGMLHGYMEEKCPDSLADRAEELTIHRANKPHSFLQDLYGVLFSKPVWSAAMLSVIISVITVSIYLRQIEQPRHYRVKEITQEKEQAGPYTQKEIAMANEQASAALQMVGRILSSTKSTVMNEVIPEKVSKPVNKSLSIVRNLFNKENTNEKIN